MILRSQPDSLFSILLISAAEIFVAVVRLLRGLSRQDGQIAAIDIPAITTISSGRNISSSYMCLKSCTAGRE